MALFVAQSTAAPFCVSGSGGSTVMSRACSQHCAEAQKHQKCGCLAVKHGEVVISEGVQAVAHSSIREGEAYGTAGVDEPELFAYGSLCSLPGQWIAHHAKGLPRVSQIRVLPHRGAFSTLIPVAESSPWCPEQPCASMLSFTVAFL